MKEKYLYPFPKKLTVEERAEKKKLRDEKNGVYFTPQPDIPSGTRVRKLPKNMRNKLCTCHSGKKFKKCCMDVVNSESLYTVS